MKIDFQLLLMSLFGFIVIILTCCRDGRSEKATYKIKRIQPNSYCYGRMDFVRIDARYKVGDTIMWDDNLHVIRKKMP